jgi:hypothetical protein
MKRLNAKLIISDFDGTLIDSNHKVSPNVRKVIDDYVKDGGIFAVCTGRMLASILPQVRELGLNGLVVACQGTVIADIKSGQLIRHGGFSCSQSAEICKVLEDMHAYVNAYADDVLITDIPKENKYLLEYEKITGIIAKHVDMPISEYILQNNIKCQKVASLCFPEEKIKLFNDLSGIFKSKYDVTYSADVLVEVSPAGDDKGNALKYLANHYNIDIKDTVAIGDNLNDLSMIQAAGVGVAVGNATQPLKDEADFITITNDEGAVAEVIKKFGYINL